MSTFTSDTCEFGLARTIEGCVRTLSWYCDKQYTTSQIIYFVAGFLAWMLCGYKYVSSVRNDGGKLQRQIFMLCGYASLTIMLRGIDPGSYGHFVPRAVNQFFTDSCNATLYTIYIKSLFFYVSVSHLDDIGKAGVRTFFERTSILLIWAFYAVSSLSFTREKGFGGFAREIRLFVGAGFLAIISIGFAVYGLQVIRQLEYMDAMNNYRNRQLQSVESCPTVDYNDSYPREESIFELENEKPQKPADRIRKILIATQSAAFICVGAQVVFAISSSESSNVELECANGVECDKLKANVSLLHIFQYVWVLIAVWCYRTIQKQPDTATFDSPQSENEWEKSYQV
ncbi:hypothetical protein FI667_g3036, partial [Globisporangium splendens]